MRRFVLVCLVALAATTAGGCFISSGDDDVDDLAFIVSNWDFITANGQRLSCPPGFPTVRVEARGRESIDDLYDCVDLTSGNADYLPGVYDVTMRVTNDAGNSVYASSLTYNVNVTNVDATIKEDFVDDGGRVLVGVDLFDAATGVPETCASAIVDGIAVDFTVAGTGILISDLFDCQDAADGAVAITAPLLAGDYVASISAIDPAGNSLSPRPTNENVRVTAPNGYFDLIGVDVDVD
jgi:hypothetical protein